MRSLNQGDLLPCNSNAATAKTEFAGNQLRATRLPLGRHVISLSSGILAAVVALAFFYNSVVQGLHLFEFPDELEQFVIAKMINHGWRLYKDIIEQHGPLPYLLSHLYSKTVSDSYFLYIRFVTPALALALSAGLMLFPALRTLQAKLWAAAICLILLSCVWCADGLNTFTYNTLSGFLLSIIMIQCIAPPMLGIPFTGTALWVSGVAATLACSCTYANTPAVIVLILPLFIFRRFVSVGLAGRMSLMPLYIGILLTLAIVLAWIQNFGDLRGFYIYHFYFNQVIYRKYIDFHPWDFLKNLSFSLSPENTVHILALIFLVCWVYIFVTLSNTLGTRRQRVVGSLSVALAILAVFFTNPRAFTAPGDCGFVIANVTMVSLSSAVALERKLLSGSRLSLLSSALLCAFVLLLVRHAAQIEYLWIGVPRKEASNYMITLQPSQAGIYRWVRGMTQEDGDLLALNYDEAIYFNADRLPAFQTLYYLPWEADYYRNPKGGYGRDLCKKLGARKPAVIWFYNWRVWSRYSLDEYEPCVLSSVVAAYAPLRFASPWLVRKDLLQKALRTLPADANTALDFGGAVPKDVESTLMRLSPPLSPSNSIALKLSPSYEGHKAPLRRIAILLATNGRHNDGIAELRLMTSDGKPSSYRFELSSLRDNVYRYFNVDAKWYVSAEIVSVSGGGVSTWESNDETPYTCMIFEYVDETRRYTPACPVM
jgi:predicted secreted protein